MTVLRVALSDDLDDLLAHERLSRDELARVLACGRVLLAVDAGKVVGWLRWGLFWDELPFMNLLMVVESHRGQGLGRHLVEQWERAHREEGHALVMTSTLSDEAPQHFYRHLGYVDAGCLLLPGEAAELFLTKQL